jgi:predicted membrane-bound spermidine synthase
MFSAKDSASRAPWALLVLAVAFFISGFTALLYQVVWQRVLGLFSGSDVRSVTIVVASYLAGLGLGSLWGGLLSDRLSRRRAVQIFGLSNLAIAVFAVFSRFLFYDLLFLRLRLLAESPVLLLPIVFISLLIPTSLMGLSLPLLSKAISGTIERAAARIGLLYGINTLGAGLGTLISGWYLVGTLGYEKTIYLGAILSALVGLAALTSASHFGGKLDSRAIHTAAVAHLQPSVPSVRQWYGLVFLSGFAAISLEIIWFRVLDIALQSIAYTYAHLLAFILISNALGSLIGARAIQSIRNPRKAFLCIQGIVAAYSLLAVWLISWYWQFHPELRSDIGYIDPKTINREVIFKYGVLPLVMIGPPNLLLGFYFPIVQKAVQTDGHRIGRRVGLIQIANILGNTTGSLLTGLVLLDQLGTAGSLRLLGLLGLGFVLLLNLNWMREKLIGGLALVLIATVMFFPNNSQLWAALHAVKPPQYFIAAEDSTGVAAITEVNRQGSLLAGGQAQAHFPYWHAHTLLGAIPALLHPHPAQVMIIGMGSGGTPHTIGVNPLTQRVQVVELLGAELSVLRQYANTPVGRPLNFLLQDPRYEFKVGDGRRELAITRHQFDIIEADAIQPWRSRAGMLYSQEFFREVQSHLAPGGLAVQWHVGVETEPTFRSVFPHVTRLYIGGLSILLGSDRPIDFNRKAILSKLDLPTVLKFLAQAEVDVEAIRRDVNTAEVFSYPPSQKDASDGVNTDLFPRSEYYLNRPIS